MFGYCWGHSEGTRRSQGIGFSAFATAPDQMAHFVSNRCHTPSRVYGVDTSTPLSAQGYHQVLNDMRCVQPQRGARTMHRDRGVLTCRSVKNNKRTKEGPGICSPALFRLLPLSTKLNIATTRGQVLELACSSDGWFGGEPLSEVQTSNVSPSPASKLLDYHLRCHRGDPIHPFAP